MRFPVKIDLHMHTTVSDGTDTPEEIFLRVRENGLAVFSVTDHDAVKGCGIIRGLLKEDDPRFIPGVEFSCRDEEGKYHILGYAYDPDAEAVLEIVRKGHEFRMQKVLRRLEYLKDEYRIRFPQEEIDRLLAMDNPGKPHIANMMVRHGYTDTKEDAIRQFIDNIRFSGYYIRPEEAIRGILNAGGIPVLAHPPFGSGSQLITGTEMDQRLKRLMGYGLQGVEAYYSGYSPKLQEEMLAFADRYGLYVTAGSDYHGRNKMISIGDTGLGETGEYPSGLERFLSAVLEEDD